MKEESELDPLRRREAFALAMEHPAEGGPHRVDPSRVLGVRPDRYRNWLGPIDPDADDEQNEPVRECCAGVRSNTLAATCFDQSQKILKLP